MTCSDSPLRIRPSMISTIGANRGARRTALVHMYFNLVGVVLFCIIFYGLGVFIDWKFLGDAATASDIAVVHTGFNLAATAVLMPMNRLLEKLAYLTIPAEPVHQKPILLDELLLATPAVAIQRAREIAGKMADTSAKAMELAIGLTKQYDPSVMQQVIDLENETDLYEDALGSYLVKLTAKDLNIRDNRTLNTLLYAISDIERIADHAVAVAKAGEEINAKGINFSDAAKKELGILEQAVMDIVNSTVAAFNHDNMDEAMRIEPLEQVVDSLVKEIKARHVRRLRDGMCTVEYGFVLEDLLTAFGRTADHCSNVAVEMLQVAEGKLEAHEYLGALKAGELQESAQFTKRFNTYKEKYAFDDEKSE